MQAGVRGGIAALWRGLGVALLTLFLIVALYAFAASLGAIIPRNSGWAAPVLGVPVYTRSNGVHVDLVLPMRAAGVDWSRLVPPEDVADPAVGKGWVAFGWGQRDFYLETRYWSDLRPGTAVKALTGGDALMHVEHLGRPRPGPDVGLIRLSPAAYRTLAREVAASFRAGPGGGAILIPGAGYEDNEAFYDARGRYSAIRTSNQWTADMLARAGVRVGHWTPLAHNLMWRFAEER